MVHYFYMLIKLLRKKIDQNGSTRAVLAHIVYQQPVKPGKQVNKFGNTRPSARYETKAEQETQF